MRGVSRVRPVRAGVLGIAILVQGCTTLGPEYHPPDVAWLSDWQPDLYGHRDAALPGQGESDLRFWWRVFNDPVLNQLVDLARKENNGLRIAGLRILESRAQLGIAGSTLYPQLQQLSGSAVYLDSRSFSGSSADAQTSLVDYQAAFSLGWELDFWGRFRRGVESADAAFFASTANQQDAQVLLSAQVADLYFAFRTAQLRIAIARENAAIQKRSFDITRKIYESGEQSELDLQQAKTQYLATLATIPDLEIALTHARNALCVLLGRPPGELPELGEAAGGLPVVEPRLVAEVPARLLLRRPDVRAAAWQVAAQSAQIGIAEADYYPAISLFGNLGWSGNSLGSSAENVTFAFGPGFTWNLLDHGRIANNIRVQDARLQQLIEQYRLILLDATREIDDAAVAIARSAERQDLQHQTVIAARRALELANTRYKEGYADFQRVLDAQRALFSQTESELVGQANRVTAVIALYKGLGGGWLDTPVEQLVDPSTRQALAQRSDWGDLLDAELPSESSTEKSLLNVEEPSHE